MKVAIIGTGYVGLVSGTCLSEIGHDVTCMDIDEAKIAKLSQGEMPIYEPGLKELVLQNYHNGRLKFTSDLQQLQGAEVIFFALPTPPGGDGEADLSYILRAAKDVAKVITDYTVFVNKSTVPVGTVQKVHDVIAAETKVAFDVVSNPEFLREGFAVTDFMQGDRIVVGTDSKQARDIMEELYRPLITEGMRFIAMDAASAEMTKYAANSFLAAKISFMNEVANLCELVGADVDMVREGVGSDDRIGPRFLYAGIGYGGSCFPKDVLAMERVAQAKGYDFKILKAVMDVNTRQKQILVQKLVADFGEDLSGKTIAMWGLAFKADTDDIREAPALQMIQELLDRGASVQAYDPEAIANTKRVYPTIAYAESATAALEGADMLIVATDWKEFMSVAPSLLAEKLAAKSVYDGRNIFQPEAMAAAGLRYASIGRKGVPADA